MIDFGCEASAHTEGLIRGLELRLATIGEVGHCSERAYSRLFVFSALLGQLHLDLLVESQIVRWTVSNSNLGSILPSASLTP